MKNTNNPLTGLVTNRKRKNSTVIEQKSKAVAFADVIDLVSNTTDLENLSYSDNLSYEDLVLRSPRLDEYPQESKEITATPQFFKTSPSKSILKRKTEIPQKKLDRDKLIIQDKLKKKIYLCIHNGFTTIIKQIIKISGKKQAKKQISTLFSAMADHYRAQIIANKKSKNFDDSVPLQQTFFKVPIYNAAKAAIMIDLYRGALQLCDQESVKVRYEKALIDFEGVEKTRKQYNHKYQEGCYLKVCSKALIKRVLDDYIEAIIGLYQGSFINQITKEFIDLINTLYEEIEKGKIDNYEKDSNALLCDLKDLQYNVMMINNFDKDTDFKVFFNPNSAVMRC